MLTRTLAFAALLGLGLIAFDGTATDLNLTENAAAYCEYYTEDGGCSNSCKDSARAFKKVTGKDAPWMCPQ